MLIWCGGWVVIKISYILEFFDISKYPIRKLKSMYFFNCTKNFIKWPYGTIYNVLNNNFFYAQLNFTFVPQKDSCYTFFSFFSSDKFWSLFQVFFLPFFFILQKDFDIFCVFLFTELIFVLFIVVICQFYI